MPDERENLLVPRSLGDTPIVSLEEAREEAESKKKRPGDRLNDFMTRGEARETLAKLSLAIGEKVYGQIADETKAFLVQMEMDLYNGLAARIENERRARSWYGRFRTLLLRWGAREQPPRLAPRVIDPVEALDPGVAEAAMHATDEDDLRPAS